jgi:hypothetical protein
MATCQSLDDEVIVGAPGVVTRVSSYVGSPIGSKVHLNDYTEDEQRPKRARRR